jgi:hypothetical protein
MGTRCKPKKGAPNLRAPRPAVSAVSQKHVPYGTWTAWTLFAQTIQTFKRYAKLSSVFNETGFKTMY